MLLSGHIENIIVSVLERKIPLKGNAVGTFWIWCSACPFDFNMFWNYLINHIFCIMQIISLFDLRVKLRTNQNSRCHTTTLNIRKDQCCHTRQIFLLVQQNKSLKIDSLGLLKTWYDLGRYIWEFFVNLKMLLKLTKQIKVTFNRRNVVFEDSSTTQNAE